MLDRCHDRVEPIRAMLRRWTDVEAMLEQAGAK